MEQEDNSTTSEANDDGVYHFDRCSQNLCGQWQAEIRKHVDDAALRVLVMEDSKKDLPSPKHLRTYDIVLFTRADSRKRLKMGLMTKVDALELLSFFVDALISELLGIEIAPAFGLMTYTIRR